MGLRRLLLKMLDTTGASDGDTIVYDAALDEYGPSGGAGAGFFTLEEVAIAPALPAAGDWRFFIDSTETVPLLKAIDSTGTVIPYWPIYVIPNGGTPPSDLHPKVIILEEGP